MTNRTIPFFSLQKQVKKDEQNFLAIFSEILQKQEFIGGHAVESFEKKLAQYLGVSHVVGCNSGTDGLNIALRALELQKKSIVLTTPFSFIASSSEIVANGAYPVYIDIDENTFNINPKKMRSWLEQNATIKNGKTIHTKTELPIEGMVVVDLFGQCADYFALKEIAEEWGLWIIEDACQAIGASVEGLKAGTLGTISVFSFYPTKNLGAFGDAGCLTTEDPYLAERIRRIRNHGRKNHYEYEELGLNSRLDGIQAAILSYKLDQLEEYNQKRRLNAERYQQNLADCSYVTLPQQIIGHHVYHQYSIKVANQQGISLQKELQSYLKEEGIGTNIFYPVPLHQIPFIAPQPTLKTECPHAERISKNILALPVWPELEKDDIDYICDRIKAFPAIMLKKANQPQQVQV